MRPKDLLEYGYLSYYFTSRQFIKSLVIVTYGIRDGRSINVDEWLDMKIVIPTKERQRHIVRTIKVFENRIENEEMYASCLLKQKQYLLRKCLYKHLAKQTCFLAIQYIQIFIFKIYFCIQRHQTFSHSILFF